MRGLYGQSEGNEKRGASAQFSERIQDNEIVEGRHVATLRRMVGDRDWKAVENYTNKLKTDGHSQARVDSMVSRAMAGMRF
jgi:hypothetical protein